jgi:mono/diheme cytochrome c family protein/YHS domain-containing protein
MRSLLALCLPPLLAAQQPVDFLRDIAPLLQDRCVECHGPEKQKGDLRLDRKEHLFTEDRESWVVQPGKPDESELLRRIQLPADDEDVMPNKGELLRPAQIEQLRQWVVGGADWPPGGDEFFAAAAAARVVPKIDFGIAAPDAAMQQRIDQALAALAERGIRAQIVAADTPAVDVNAALLRERVGDQDLASLADLAPVLVWLNLSRTAVTDDGLAQLSALQQLRRLNLANTGIGDAGVEKLGVLERLEVLNLYGSKVTDAGLRRLAALPALRRVYAFDTAVTAAAAAELAQRQPPVVVDRGEYVAERLHQAAAEIAARAAAAPAAPINATCPVSDKPVDAATAIDHEGLRIAFCCEKCKQQFLQEPARYGAKIADYRRALGKDAPAAEKPPEKPVEKPVEKPKDGEAKDRGGA